MKVISKILITLNVLAIIPLIICYLAHLISPDQFPYFLVFTFAYPYVLGINFLFFILWLFINRKIALIALVIILIGSPLIIRLIPIQGYFRKLSPQNDDLKILSYNVRLFNLYNWREKDNLKDAMFSFVEAQNPDIACFQEYFWSSNDYFPTTQVLTEKLNAPYNYYTTSIEPIGNQHFGIATFSKYPIVNKGEISFENTHNLIIYTDILYLDDTIRIYNCHLQSMYFNEDNYNEIDNLNLDRLKDGKVNGLFPVLKKIIKSSQIRTQQSNTLAKNIKSSPYPVIVCGDFNDNPFSYTYTTIKANLKDSYTKAARKPGYTWKKSLITQRIDFVFYPKEFICTNHKVIHIDYSDHFPLIVSLRKNN